MNTFPMLLRREAWEHRALWLTPTVLAGVIIPLIILGVFGSLAGVFTVTGDFGEIEISSRDAVGWLMAAPEGAREQGLGTMMWGINMIFTVFTAIVVFFYLLDTLYAERKDRSILFWKSLPVSDTNTVLSKLAMGAIVAPLLAVGAGLVTSLVVVLVMAIVIAAGDGSVTELLLGPLPFFRSIGMFIYDVITRAIWYVPIFGWLLLASAWAKRSPFLWAMLVPGGAMLLERFLYYADILPYPDSLASLLGWRLHGYESLAYNETMSDWDVHIDGGPSRVVTPLVEATPADFFASLDTWLGLIVGGLFITGAIMLRRYRDET